MSKLARAFAEPAIRSDTANDSVQPINPDPAMVERASRFGIKMTEEEIRMKLDQFAKELAHAASKREGQ